MGEKRPSTLPPSTKKLYEPIAKPIALGSENDQQNPKIDQIYFGDTVSILQKWPENSFDACITDPPYNIASNRKGIGWAFSSHVTIQDEWDRFSDDEYEAFTTAWLKEICRTCKENANIFIFGSYHNIYTIGALATKLNLRIINSIIWLKPNAQPNITCRMFTESTEQILWLCNNTVKNAKHWTFNYQEMKKQNGNKQMRNYWEIPVASKRERQYGIHPAQKPVYLMERLVMAGTNPGDKVIDCFAGSGSTLLACDQQDRRWVGIERNAQYCELAHRRLDEERRMRCQQNIGPQKFVTPT